MKYTGRLSPWQFALLLIGATLILVPIGWDTLNATLLAVVNVSLEDILSRGGMFVIGLALLSVVGFVEIVKDFRDKPKSKYIK